MKRIIATFYATESGNEPVREWLLELDKADRKIVGVNIAQVEFGWPIGMPVSRPLRDDVLEVRSTIKDGRVEARTYYAVEGSVMLLLHGREGKNGQKEAIDLAVERLRDHRRREKARKKAREKMTEKRR